MEIPLCCRQCLNLDSEYSEWSDQTFWYCRKNIWFPTKKQTCKAQQNGRGGDDNE